ncbi:MAG: transporter permease [Paenibacillus sp.]|jgi:ABC-2 type transport system permease protein|nr:transporter permease [Paenibacillus sp.]
MRPYAAVLKLRLLNGMQYRAAALAGVATQFFFGFLFIMVFEAFYSQAAEPPPMPMEQLVPYLWLQQAFLALITLWFRDNELFQLITTGNIAYELCRPAGIYEFWYAKLIAQRLSSALLRCFPILIIVFFLPDRYAMSLPANTASFVAFIVAMALGLLLVVAISMLMYISVFVTLSSTGSLLMFSIVSEFFSGRIIPLPLMPDWLERITSMLPFHLTADFIFRVYSGNIAGVHVLYGILAQIGWLAAIVLLGKFALSRALRKVTVQGG